MGNRRQAEPDEEAAVAAVTAKSPVEAAVVAAVTRAR